NQTRPESHTLHPHAHAHTHTHTHTHTLHTHTHAHTHTHTPHTHARAHTHTHTHYTLTLHVTLPKGKTSLLTSGRPAPTKPLWPSMSAAPGAQRSGERRVGQ